MFFETLVVNNFAVNCYIVGCEESHKAVVIDPGGSPDKILEIIEAEGLEISLILNTHGHIDHIMGNQDVKEKSGAPLRIHEEDAEMLSRAGEQSIALLGTAVYSPVADSFLTDGEKIEVGSMEIEVIHTPGHSPGGVCFKTGNKLFTGDTLFAQSIGRTDIRGGDMKTLMRSIMDKVMIQDDETEIFPGHGPSSKIGLEKKWNPFVNGMASYTDI